MPLRQAQGGLSITARSRPAALQPLLQPNRVRKPRRWCNTRPRGIGKFSSPVAPAPPALPCACLRRQPRPGQRPHHWRPASARPYSAPMVHSADSAAQAAAAEGAAFEIVSAFQPAGRPARGHHGADCGVARRRARAGAARRHRVGQDLHHDPRHRGAGAAHADPRAEQDSRCPALRRDEGVPAEQRGRVLRVLLRLLSARGLCAALGYLYREGRLDQRAHRPHAPQRDAGAAGAPGCRDRGLGLVHLRHRRGRDLFVHGRLAGARRPCRSARAHPQAGRPAVSPHQPVAGARQLPRARRRDRALPGAFGGPRLAHLALRRRDRGDRRVRSPDRRQDRPAGARAHLPQQPLRHAAPDRAPGDQADQDRARPAPGGVQRARPAARGPAAGAAHELRPGDDGGDRHLRRHRELFALSDRPQSGRAAADAVRVSAGERASHRGRIPRHRAPAWRHVPRRLPPQVDARRVRLPPALLRRQPAPQVRGMGRHAAGEHLRVGDAGTVGAGAHRRGLHRAGDPPDRADRPGVHGPPRRAPGRRPDARSARPAPAGGSGCWSPRSPSAWPRT